MPASLLINQDAHLQRVTNPTRRNRWKSIDLKYVYDETPLLSIAHPNFLELNVSRLSPEDAVNTIMSHIQLLET